MTSKTPRIAVYVSKQRHIELLRSVATQLGSSSLKDGLEHVLNCYLTGNSPNVVSLTHSPPRSPLNDDVDEFDGLVSFED